VYEQLYLFITSVYFAVLVIAALESNPASRATIMLLNRHASMLP